MSDPISSNYTRQLSTELWLRIFRNLDRNDLDSCEHVCQSWFHIVRFNKKFLPGRQIEYVIISTKRMFTMTLCSGKLIKIYRFKKYHDTGTLGRPVNDQCMMEVETIRRHKYSRDPSSLIWKYRESSNVADDKQRDLFLQMPPVYVKSQYKIGTPPLIFFDRLNMLLANCSSINYFVLHDFTLTKSFVTKFMKGVRPGIRISLIELIRFKRTKVDNQTIEFFFTVLLGRAGNIQSHLSNNNVRDRYLTHVIL